jgi:hypothetical protein
MLPLQQWVLKNSMNLFFLMAMRRLQKKTIVANASKYIEFGLNNANTYDLMFGTSVGNFADFPDLLLSANQTYDNMKDNFSNLANDSEEVVAFKCITLWSMLHGLVGIIRKVNVAGDDYDEGSGPISTASKIADNLEEHLDKVISGLISN